MPIQKKQHVESLFKTEKSTSKITSAYVDLIKMKKYKLFHYVKVYIYYNIKKL